MPIVVALLVAVLATPVYDDNGNLISDGRGEGADGDDQSQKEAKRPHEHQAIERPGPRVGS